MPSTITPIERALPATMRIAASRSAAFKSGIFALAISSTCLRLILPTLSVCGRGLPDSMPAAFLISTVVGGVLMMKLKLLSAYAVITTGSGRPGSTFCVCALNALQNSMMLRPRWPSAGPMGGDGFALPAGTCSLIKPTIFFAMSGFLHLSELELDRSRAPKNRHRDAQAALLVVHVLDGALEIGERAFLHAHHLAHLEEHLGLGLLHAFAHLLHDRLDLLLGDRGGLGCRAADEAGHLVGVLHQVPGVVAHLHLDQHVAGKELALRHVLLAALHLDHFLDRHQDLAELVLHSGPGNPVLERPLHGFLESGIGMHDVPTLAHVFFQPRMTS